MITGKQFNDTYRGIEVVKLTVEDNRHRDIKYEDGVNVLIQQFDPEPICGPGGLYCCFKKDLGKWFNYGDKIMHNIWTVTIPDDAKVVVMYGKIKVDKFILSNMSDLLTHDNFLIAVTEDDWNLCEVPKKYRSYKMCAAAVKNGASALFDVPPEHRTGDLYLIMAENDSYALDYIPEKYVSYEICMAIIRQDGMALNDVPEKYQTYDLCTISVKQDGTMLYYVPKEHRDIDMCITAVKQNQDAINDVPDELKEKIKNMITEYM